MVKLKEITKYNIYFECSFRCNNPIFKKMNNKEITNEISKFTCSKLLARLTISISYQYNYNQISFRWFLYLFVALFCLFNVDF